MGGNDAVTGHIISVTIGGKNDEPMLQKTTKSMRAKITYDNPS
jgi:VCBS repeat-containing protein